MRGLPDPEVKNPGLPLEGHHGADVSFRPGTGIFLSITRPGPVTLDIVDTRGRTWSLNKNVSPAGIHRLNDLPPLARGIYSFRLRTAGGIYTGRLMILD